MTDKPPVTFRDELKLFLPAWLVDLHGPFFDEIGWPLQIVKFAVIAGILHFACELFQLPVGNGVSFIVFGLAMVFLAWLMPKE